MIAAVGQSIWRRIVNFDHSSQTVICSPSLLFQAKTHMQTGELYFAHVASNPIHGQQRRSTRAGTSSTMYVLVAGFIVPLVTCLIMLAL